MAWRRYPKYEKKIKTYKDYTHLTYQEINNVRYDFDDSVILQHALEHAGRV